MSSSEEIWRQSMMQESSSIDQAITNLEKTGIKIVLVVDSVGKLLGTISDGDIRRGLLNGLYLKSTIKSIVNYNALVVPPEISRQMVLQLMMVNKIHQIPIVDEQQKLIGLHLWDEITTVPTRQNLMVIMVGGKGTRFFATYRKLS